MLGNKAAYKMKNPNPTIAFATPQAGLHFPVPLNAATDAKAASQKMQNRRSKMANAYAFPQARDLSNHKVMLLYTIAGMEMKHCLLLV